MRLMVNTLKAQVLILSTCILSSCGGGGGSSPPVVSAPSAPTNVVGTGVTSSIAGRAYVSFSAPASSNGSTITGYTASCTNSGITKVGTASASPIVVSGLLNATQYSCSVTASSSAGVSPASSAVQVSTPSINANHLRVLYAIPTDRTFNQSWADALSAEMVDLQQWYANQLGGKTFTVYTEAPEVCHLPSPSSAYFSTNTWNTISADVATNCGVVYGALDTDWVIYADVIHDETSAGRIGAGIPGMAIFPRQDLEGLGGASCVTYSDGKQYCFPQTRWVGGAGHEIGHTFGVPHPPGCDAGLPTCDVTAQNDLMWLGYTTYPNTYFEPYVKTILLASKFIQ